MSIEEEIIETYRRIIFDRYQYDYISENYDLDNTFSVEELTNFRSFFLDYVYPPIEKRHILNQAFDKLDNHIKNPKSLLTLLMRSSGILFKYGRHLPRILKIAMMALQSFRSANAFETALAEQAENTKIDRPISKEKLFGLIACLSQEQINSFIETSSRLFSTIKDEALIKKILHIVDVVIKNMKKDKSSFSSTEIQSFELGKEILSGSYELFSTLSSNQKNQLFEIVIYIERLEIEKIFERYKK